MPDVGMMLNDPFESKSDSLNFTAIIWTIFSLKTSQLLCFAYVGVRHKQLGDCSETTAMFTGTMQICNCAMAGHDQILDFRTP